LQGRGYSEQLAEEGRRDRSQVAAGRHRQGEKPKSMPDHQHGGLLTDEALLHNIAHGCEDCFDLLFLRFAPNPRSSRWARRCIWRLRTGPRSSVLQPCSYDASAALCFDELALLLLRFRTGPDRDLQIQAAILWVHCSGPGARLQLSNVSWQSRHCAISPRNSMCGNCHRRFPGAIRAH